MVRGSRKKFCKHGHDRTLSGAIDKQRNCVQCQRRSQAAYCQANPEKRRRSQVAWSQANKEKCNAVRLTYRRANMEKIRENSCLAYWLGTSNKLLLPVEAIEVVKLFRQLRKELRNKYGKTAIDRRYSHGDLGNDRGSQEGNHNSRSS